MLNFRNCYGNREERDGCKETLPTDLTKVQRQFYREKILFSPNIAQKNDTYIQKKELTYTSCYRKLDSK